MHVCILGLGLFFILVFLVCVGMKTSWVYTSSEVQYVVLLVSKLNDYIYYYVKFHVTIAFRGLIKLFFKFEFEI